MQSAENLEVPLPKRIGTQLISRINIGKGYKVLDLGCGFGGFSVVLSELVGPDGKVVAVDPDAGRIRSAENKNARPNIEYLVGTDQTFPGEQYDLVFANGIVHWVSNKEALFERVFNKLRPGGVFALSTPNGCIDFPSTSLKLFELLHPKFLEDVFYRNMLVEGEGVYKRIATSVGFEIEHTNSLVMPNQYNSVEECIDWYIKFMPNDFDRETIDKVALKKYRDGYEAELQRQPDPYNILFMHLMKPKQ